MAVCNGPYEECYIKDDVSIKSNDQVRGDVLIDAAYTQFCDCGAWFYQKDRAFKYFVAIGKPGV